MAQNPRTSSSLSVSLNSTRRVGVSQGRGCEGRKLKTLTGNTRGRGSVGATCATSGLCCAVNRAQNLTYRPLVHDVPRDSKSRFSSLLATHLPPAPEAGDDRLEVREVSAILP